MYDVCAHMLMTFIRDLMLKFIIVHATSIMFIDDTENVVLHDNVKR